MNGNCYFSEGLNPAVTCNKNEGNRVDIPVLTPERTDKRQNGRRFKEDGDPAFTLTSIDRHGVAVDVEPMQMSGYKCDEQNDAAHALNCSGQRKVFGANQARTMAGYMLGMNATRDGGGSDRYGTGSPREGSQRTRNEQATDDDSSGMFAIDKGIRPDERDVANCIESREDRGLSKRKQEGTLICVKL